MSGEPTSSGAAVRELRHRPLRPTQYSAAARRIAALAASIDKRANASTPHELAARTRAVNALARAARELYLRNAALPRDTPR